MLSGMLYPYVDAKNEANEEDKMTARVMCILVQNHLEKAGYDTKFLFMVLSALVNPATFVEVEWVEAIQRVKQQMTDGSVKIIEAIDELLTGLNLNIIPVDEILLTDFYSGTGEIQRLPAVLRIRRIPWDEARAKYEGKYKDNEGKDTFRYVQAGMTRIMIAGQEHQELFDIEWTEADPNYVQEITAYYRSEDLEVKFVGGVFMGNYTNVFNTNPFNHRRLTLLEGNFISVPIVPIVMSGFEPIDPAGRFAYYKSGAFKEYWDDQALNVMHRLAIDGTMLDVMKPIFISGVAKVDTTVVIPGATVGIPSGQTATPFNIGPNLKATYDAIHQQESDMSNSTQDEILQGNTDANVTATQTNQAIQQAKIFMGVFGVMIGLLIKGVGELTMDCVINYATIGELDDSIPGALNMKYRTFLAKGNEKGRDITHKIEFTTKHMGKSYSDEQISNKEWELYNKTGKSFKERYHSDQRMYEVNPYQFARTTFTMGIDADQMIDKSIGATRNRKVLASQILSSPTVAPFTDPEAVAGAMIDEFGPDLTDDPDKLKRKDQPMQNQMLNSVMGNNQPVKVPQPNVGQPAMA